MATYVDSVADVFVWEATSGTTASFSQGSSNRFLFGGAAWATFGSTPSFTAFKYGGSGGTDITPQGSDTSFLFGNGNSTAGGVTPGPSSSTTIYTSTASALQGAGAGVAYEGVDSTADFTSSSGAAGDVGTTVASVTVPNCVTGQTVVAIVYAASTNVTLTAFSAVSGTTIRASDVGSDVSFLGICVLEKVAASNGSVTLSVNVNGTGTDTLGWAAKGLRLIDASGGGGDPSTITAAAGVATAGSMAGSSTASASITGASGTTTASTAGGSAQAQATRTSAAGTATTSTSTGSATATAAETQAAGSAAASTLAGSSTAVASFVAAAGSAAAATLASGDGPSSLTAAQGSATAGTLAGSATVVASFVAASGGASTEAMRAEGGEEAEVPGIDFSYGEVSTKTPKWWAKSGQADAQPEAQEPAKPKKAQRKASKAQEEAKKVIEAVAREQVARGDVPKTARFAEVRSQLKPLGREAADFNWPALYERLYAQALTEALRQEMARADAIQQLRQQEDEALLLLLAEA